MYMRGGVQVELGSPSVEGDALVNPNVSMSLANIIGLDHTMILLGGDAAVVLVTIGICGGYIC